MTEGIVWKPEANDPHPRYRWELLKPVGFKANLLKIDQSL